MTPSPAGLRPAPPAVISPVQRSACRVATRVFLTRHSFFMSRSSHTCRYAPTLCFAECILLRKTSRFAPLLSVASLQRQGFALGGVATPQPEGRRTSRSSWLRLVTWVGFANGASPHSYGARGRFAPSGLLRNLWGSLRSHPQCLLLGLGISPSSGATLLPVARSSPRRRVP